MYLYISHYRGHMNTFSLLMVEIMGRISWNGLQTG